MRIVIEIESMGTDKQARFSPHITVGEVETYLATCYSKRDAIRDSLRYVENELDRGQWSKFALFKDVA